VIGRLRTSGDTRRDRGGSIADMRLQLGLVVSASKPWATSLSGLGLKIQDFEAAHGVITEFTSRQSYFVMGS
jgi:hypothetical protein